MTAPVLWIEPTDDLAVPRGGLFEIVLPFDRALDNPFTDARCHATFTSPAGSSIRVEGFCNAPQEWRIRFVPREEGHWTFKATLQTGDATVTRDGAFHSRGSTSRGFLRLSNRNPYRLEYEDGTPFYPVGVQTCSFLQPDCDGPNPDGSGCYVSNAEWLTRFQGAVNLVRTQLGQGTTDGCALPLIPVGGPPDRYDLDLARRIDEAYVAQRAAGISQILIPFQDMSLWAGEKARPSAFGESRDLRNYKSLAAPNLPLQEQYLRYVVARWGCFVDIWEIFNEDSFAPDDYLAHLAAVIRAADPYNHLLTTNYMRPPADWCDIVTFHEYMGMPAEGVDAYLSSQFALYKSYGKPVQNTEFGNQRAMPNVDPVKWRIAVWVAFMHECGLLFWSMSHKQYHKHGEVLRCNANAYLGPDTRAHLRIFNDFVRDLPIDLRPVPAGFTKHRDLRLYALSNGQTSVLYVHHFADHANPYVPTSPKMVQTGPGQFEVTWINPSTGDPLSRQQATTPQQFLEVEIPPFTIDAVARIDRRP